MGLGHGHGQGGHGHSHGHSQGGSAGRPHAHPQTHGHGLMSGETGSRDDDLMPPTDTSLARKRLRLTLIITAAYMVAEVVGGILTNSLALLADSAHMLSDVASLGLSLFALWLSTRPPSSKLTFGFHRSEILAALINGSTLVGLSFFIFYEAWERFHNPPEVKGLGMSVIAAGGLVMNLVGLYLLGQSKEHSLNIRGAWLHVMADALGSVGALLAGLLIYFLGWRWVDPAVSVLIGLLVIQSSWGLLRDSVSVLMESAPGYINVDEVRLAMSQVPGVVEVHDLHVWSISSRLDALIGHVVIEHLEQGGEVLRALRLVLQERFGLRHVTLQLEPKGYRELHCPHYEI
ncbi:MAG: cation diffusion facilitator family transporter [Myxococcota bacterium]